MIFFLIGIIRSKRNVRNLLCCFQKIISEYMNKLFRMHSSALSCVLITEKKKLSKIKLLNEAEIFIGFLGDTK